MVVRRIRRYDAAAGRVNVAARAEAGPRRLHVIDGAGRDRDRLGHVRDRVVARIVAGRCAEPVAVARGNRDGEAGSDRPFTALSISVLVPSALLGTTSPSDMFADAGSTPCSATQSMPAMTSASEP